MIEKRQQANIDKIKTDITTNVKRNLKAKAHGQIKRVNT